MAKVERHYARVSLVASLVLTIPIPVNATKGDLKSGTLDALRLLTDSDDALTVKIPESLGQYNAKVYPPKRTERDIDENTLFTLKGIELIDIFDATVEEDDVVGFK